HQFISNPQPRGCYNIVCPNHPPKKEVIQASAKKYFFNYPLAYKPKNSFQKRVRGKKITELLKYKFKYSSPIDF
ncbi:MAG: hypothetical protein ACRDE7_10205, partial [Sphingobacterium sp.]